MGLPAESAMSSVDKDALIKSSDMSESMKLQAVEAAKEALTENSMEKDIASHVKKRFDSLYGPTWHCVVGRSFGSFVTHESGNFVYFYLRANKQAVLLFKAG